MKTCKKLLIPAILLILAVLYLGAGRKEIANQAHGWNLILVNENRYIPENYEVELAILDNGKKVDIRIYPALQEMLDTAQSEGVYMVVAEGYRTGEEQQEMLDEKVEEYRQRVLVKFVAERMAKKWVAVPGTSEHELGIAVDINADGIHSTGQEVYAWLAENAHHFGFIQRYPSDKSDITGISYEPWHYRYVGEEDAQKIYEQKICLEEYIDKL